MEIILNGTKIAIDKTRTVAWLLDNLEISRPGTAVAINGEILPKDIFDDHALAEGDKVDILRAIGGG
jgi:sulfur carrier protein